MLITVDPRGNFFPIYIDVWDVKKLFFKTETDDMYGQPHQVAKKWTMLIFKDGSSIDVDESTEKLAKRINKARGICPEISVPYRETTRAELIDLG